MKNRVFVLIAFLLTANFVFAQSKNTLVLDTKLNKNVLVGYCNRNGLKSGLFGEYFITQYTAYKPSKSYIKKIKDKIDKTKITIIFGSWCGDSKLQVPRFYKILDKTGYNENDVNLIAVNTSLAALTTDISKLNITKIPTFIIYENGKELGRIVESPKKSLEKDLWKIVKKVH